MGNQKIQVDRDLISNGKIFHFVQFNQCVNSFRDDLVKRLYKVDAKTESCYVGIAKIAFSQR